MGNLAGYAGKKARNFRYKTHDGAVVDESFGHESEAKTGRMITLLFKI